MLNYYVEPTPINARAGTDHFHHLPSYSQSHLPLIVLSASGVLLAWQLRKPSSARQHIAPPHAKSAHDVFLTVVEGLLLATTLSLSRDDSAASAFANSWVGTIFGSYLGALYVLALLPPLGLKHVGRAARYHSVVLYATSWLVTINTSDVGSTTTKVSSALLATALLSPRPPRDDDGIELDDNTGESQSSIFGLWAFTWLDGMLFKAWHAGSLVSLHVPEPALLKAGDQSAIWAKRRR